MDLSSLSIRHAEEGEPLHLRHPVTDEPLIDEDGKPLTVTVIGQDAGAYRRARNALIDKRPTGKLAFSYIENESLELSVASVTGWSDNIIMDGVTLTFTPANVRKAFAYLPWMREQVDAFNAERSHFLQASPPNLSSGSEAKPAPLIGLART